MKYTETLDSMGFNGSIPATEHALYKKAKAICDNEGRMVRGVYYTQVRDPFTGFVHVTIHAWFT